jgi:trimeric autotransporter adhesin
MTFSSFVRRLGWPAAAATLGWLAAFVFVSVAHAAPPAGTTIGNQASASYLDATATPRTATSNLVNTIVQQVASFTLTADGARTAAPGGQVVFPHTLTNTGNGTDSFPLTLANLVGDDFDLTSLAIHVDANGDGVPDDFVNLASTGALAAGGVFRFVVVGNVPGTQVGGQVGRMRISAASTFDGGQTASNTDIVTVSGNAVISVTKSIDTPSGGSPSGPYTYTLTYTNSGNSAATNLRLADVVPAGMTYVAGSARWSVTGATVLTDANNADAQGVAPNTVIWDFTVGTGTAVIAQVAPGASGTVTFQVNVNAGLAPQIIGNTATYTYNDGAANVGPFTTNNAPFTVNQAASLTFTGQTIASAVQGATLVYTNTLTNTGNGSDVFDVTLGASTFPAGTSYQLYRSDGVTPLTDSNGNGTPDTGPLAAGASYAVVLQVTLPPAATGGPYQVVKTARSAASPATTANATDVLTTITPNAIDLTNDSPGPGAPGAGAGPEPAAVITNATNPNTTTRFTLYVNNNSTIADHFDLAASLDPTFGAVVLPAGWTVTFRDAGNAIVTNTGNIPAGNNVLVYADVTVPPGFAAGTYSVYFRARSPVSLASDRKHDAVTVNAVRSLTLVPNNVGQVTPGGAATYTHILSNTGNVAEGDGVVSVVSLAVTNTAASWSSALYVDSNNNGSLDGADAAIADLGSIFGLPAGTSVRLFVRVFSPPGAPLGATDLATLTATTTNGTYVSAVPPVVSATDQTTVLNGQLQIVKRQALDADCDGTPDGPYTTADITVGSIPGACLRYEIVVTNVGTASVTAVVVDDATPANTTYSDAIVAATSQGTITTPANGATGTVSANVGVLAPGASATITFGVRIDP